MLRSSLLRLCSSAAFLSCLFSLPSSAADGTSSVLVISEPKGAHVFIDNIPKGKAPTLVTNLEKGRHTVVLVLDGYKRHEATVDLAPGSSKVLKLVLAKVGAAEKTPTETEPTTTTTTTTTKDDKPPKKIEVPCPGCKGSGLIQEVGCAKCRGTGHIGHSRCSVCSGSARTLYQCKVCGGEGMDARGKKCRACRGKGAPPCMLCKGKGKIPRLNPDAASRPTVACHSCSGSGFVVEAKCRICAGTGRVKGPSRVSGGYILTTTGPCHHCGGDGYGPPVCTGCSGRGFNGTPPRHTACRNCSGTGKAFLRCRPCGGRGFGYRR